MTLFNSNLIPRRPDRGAIDGLLEWAAAFVPTVTSSGEPLLAEGMGRAQVISDQQPSAASAVTFTLGSLPRYVVSGWLRPASDAILYARIGVSGTIKSGAADYSWRVITSSGTGAADTSDSEFHLTGNSSLESTAASGGCVVIAEITHPAQATIPPYITIRAIGQTSGGFTAFEWRTACEYIGGIEAIDRFQLLFPSVNIAEGDIQMWGYQT